MDRFQIGNYNLKPLNFIKGAQLFENVYSKRKFHKFCVNNSFELTLKYRLTLTTIAGHTNAIRISEFKDILMTTHNINTLSKLSP